MESGGILPLLKHVRGEKRPAAMLAVYNGKGVAPEVNLWECIICTP